MLVSHFMITYLPAIGKLKGSFLLPAHWEGGARATLKMIAPQKNFRAKPKQAGKKEGGWGEGIFARLLLSGGMAEGGFGGNSAMPERIQKEAAPAAPLVKSRSQPKSFLFLLEEKIRRAQIKKCEENFLAGWRALASGGGAASLVGVLLKESSREVYNYSTKTNFVGNDCSARRVRRAPQGKIRFCFRRKIPEFAPITI